MFVLESNRYIPNTGDTRAGRERIHLAVRFRAHPCRLTGGGLLNGKSASPNLDFPRKSFVPPRSSGLVGVGSVWPVLARHSDNRGDISEVLNDLS
jgi:hypothetical protein